LRLRRLGTSPAHFNTKPATQQAKPQKCDIRGQLPVRARQSVSYPFFHTFSTLPFGSLFIYGYTIQLMIAYCDRKLESRRSVPALGFPRFRFFRHRRLR
ncbi:hypothetical protein Gohar_010755, partial [Gossypium harknessii]|nr:hypothetical protein [Gossypium harknessii]